MHQREYRRYGIEYFLARDIAVNVVDVNELVFPSANLGTTDPQEFPEIGIYNVSNRRELEALDTLANSASLALHLAQGTYCSKNNLPIFKQITRVGIPYLISVTNSFPGWVGETALHRRIEHIKQFFGAGGF